MSNELVFVKATYDVLMLPDFWKKLKNFIGHFRIEQQSVKESYDGVITISFSTDAVKIAEGKSRQVEIIGKNRDDGGWDFTEIKACYS